MLFSLPLSFPFLRLPHRLSLLQQTQVFFFFAISRVGSLQTADAFPVVASLSDVRRLALK